MRILFISQTCYPEPDSKKVPFAKGLIERGFEVEILTGYPNYPQGKIYPGYKNGWVRKENIQGVTVIRIPLYIDHSKSSLKRIWNYLSFAISACIFGPFKVKKPQVIYAFHAPATVAIPAIFLKFIFRAKILYDINDYWPDSLEATGMIRNKFLINLVGKFCRTSYRFFDHINVVAKGYIPKLLNDGVPDNKLSHVYNWPPPLGFNESETFLKHRYIFKDAFTVLYAGNVGKAQSLEILVNAAEQIEKDYGDSVRFIIVGDGMEKKSLMKQVEIKGLNNFYFIDQVPVREVGTFMKSANLLFMHLKKDKLFEITVPSKIFSYLSVGRPILSGVDGEANGLVIESQSGLTFNSGDTNDLILTLREFIGMEKKDLNKFGERGLIYFQENLSFERGIERFISFFKQLGTIK